MQGSSLSIIWHLFIYTLFTYKVPLCLPRARRVHGQVKDKYKLIRHQCYTQTSFSHSQIRAVKVNITLNITLKKSNSLVGCSDLSNLSNSLIAQLGNWKQHCIHNARREVCTKHFMDAAARQLLFCKHSFRCSNFPSLYNTMFDYALWPNPINYQI